MNPEHRCWVLPASGTTASPPFHGVLNLRTCNVAQRSCHRSTLQVLLRNAQFVQSTDDVPQRLTDRSFKTAFRPDGCTPKNALELQRQVKKHLNTTRKSSPTTSSVRDLEFLFF
ncbi:uncharacterized protein [Dermacentor albipictus]|uniref:uncharacterized protein n=1 Tax=Dermacentor albipictus TaxID=60249 RepID=UPI0038FC1E4E